jgi:hypothetical protein
MEKPGNAPRPPEVLRTFRVPGLEGAEGCFVLKVDDRAVYAIDVNGDTATLTTAVQAPARVAAVFDSRETLEAIVEGHLHPIVAALQSRYSPPEGDRRFGLSVLLALRASAPAFAERRPA